MPHKADYLIYLTDFTLECCWPNTLKSPLTDRKGTTWPFDMTDWSLMTDDEKNLCFRLPSPFSRPLHSLKTYRQVGVKPNNMFRGWWQFRGHLILTVSPSLSKLISSWWQQTCSSVLSRFKVDWGQWKLCFNNYFSNKSTSSLALKKTDNVLH